MRRLVILSCVIIASWMATSHLCAQDVLVSFDVAGRVMVIDAKTEARLQLFPDVRDLIEARLWRTGDTTYILEITSGSISAPVRTRRPLTLTQYQDLRTQYASAVAAAPEPVVLDQSGRPALLYGTTIAGLVYYGTAMNFVLFGDDEWSETAVALPYLIAGGGGYVLTSMLTSNSVVTKADAALAANGLIQGPMHGWLLTGLVSGDDPDIRAGFGLSLLAGIGETVAGYYVSRNSDMSHGKASVIGNTSIYGMLTAGMVGLTMTSAFEAEADPNIRLVTGLTLVGSAGGILLGNYLSSAQRYSAGDATVSSLPTLLCAAAPFVAAATVDYSGDWELITGLTAATTALGVWVGDRIVVDKEFTDDQSTLISLATFGGTLIGVGIGVLTSADQTTAALAWGGGAIGFGISYAAMASEAGLNARSMGEWKWNVNPVAPLMARSMQGWSVPFVSLTGRF